MRKFLLVRELAVIALPGKNTVAVRTAYAALSLALEYMDKDKGANTMKLSQIKAGQYFKFKDDKTGTVRRLLDIVKRPGLFKVERVTNKYWNDWDGFSADLLFFNKGHGDREIILLK